MGLLATAFLTCSSCSLLRSGQWSVWSWPKTFLSLLYSLRGKGLSYVMWNIFLLSIFKFQDKLLSLFFISNFIVDCGAKHVKHPNNFACRTHNSMFMCVFVFLVSLLILLGICVWYCIIVAWYKYHRGQYKLSWSMKVCLTCIKCILTWTCACS